MFSGIPAEISAKNRNADGTTGRQAQAGLASFSLAAEDFALITSISGATNQFQFASGRLLVDALISSDIQIGAVEIKNGTTDDRVVVRNDGVEFAMVVVQNSQPLPIGAATEATLTTRSTEATLLTRATEATLATRATEATVATLGTEATLALIKAKTDNLDTFLSTRAAEATLATRATEATLATRASESTLSLIQVKTDNLDTPLSTRATEATLATRSTEATLLTRATEATLATRATEATVATLGTEATLALIKAKTDNIDVLLSTRTKPADSQNVTGTLIVTQATGTNLHVVVDTLPSIPTGANTIGAVTQASGPWTQNITQFGGSPVVTGTGVSGVGIPRVTVANDSVVLASQNGTWTVQPGNTANTTPWIFTVNQGGNSAVVKAASTAVAAADPALAVGLSPNSPLPAGTNAIGTVKAQLQDNAGTGITSTLVSGKQSLDVSVKAGNTPSYMASTNGIVNSGTAGATVTSHAYLWHPSTDTTRYAIAMIVASVSTLDTNTGNLQLRLARITALNGTPGGTNQTINALDFADAPSTGTFTTGATGAPTRAAGDYVTKTFDASGVGNGTTGKNVEFIIFDERIAGKALICRAGVNEGYEVRSIVGTAIATAVPVAVTYYWRAV